jgi:hypothetical protein
VWCQAATPAAPSTDEAAGLILAGWTMIEVFDTAAAGIALARRKLGCPDCSKPLRPWGHARERTVRDLHGTSVTTRPDRALCPACQVTHVVLDAALLPRRAYAARLIGQALVAAVRGSGHRRIALDLDVPAGTVRGWIRGAAGPPSSSASPASAPPSPTTRTPCPRRPAGASCAGRWSAWAPRPLSSAAGSGWSTSACG